TMAGHGAYSRLPAESSTVTSVALTTTISGRVSLLKSEATVTAAAPGTVATGIGALTPPLPLPRRMYTAPSTLHTTAASVCGLVSTLVVTTSAGPPEQIMTVLIGPSWPLPMFVARVRPV